jgi:hypothetical protein
MKTHTNTIVYISAIFSKIMSARQKKERKKEGEPKFKTHAALADTSLIAFDKFVDTFKCLQNE